MNRCGMTPPCREMCSPAYRPAWPLRRPDFRLLRRRIAVNNEGLLFCCGVRRERASSCWAVSSQKARNTSGDARNKARTKSLGEIHRAIAGQIINKRTLMTRPVASRPGGLVNSYSSCRQLCITLFVARRCIDRTTRKKDRAMATATSQPSSWKNL